MNSTLSPRQVQGLRTLGAGVALALGLAVSVLLALAGAANDGSGFATAIALATPLVASPIGWALAPRALLRGWRSALGTVLAFDIAGVIAGSFLTVALTALLAPSSGSASPVEYLAAIPMLAVLGIVLFGLPALVVGLAPVIAWLAVVRWLAGRLQPTAAPAARTI